MKRILAVFLTLAMALNVAPVGAFAAADSNAASIVAIEETDESASSRLDDQTARAIASDPFLQQANAASQEQNSTIDTSDVSMEATNSFGKLLLNGMDVDKENGSSSSTGSNIQKITLNGRTATVDYTAAEDADLVVGIYADDAEEQMVASGTVAITAMANGTATVAITGDIPDYYVIKGYLFDKAEHAPLCNPFVNTFNTKNMVDLSTATVNDFPEDRVINLDDDATTNFAVVKQDVTLLTPEDSAGGKNTLTNEDNDGLNYTIANASEEIKKLQAGDILTYEYAPGELLVVKVASITISGDTVAIHGDDTLEATEVFDALKIEENLASTDFEYDGSTAQEGVEYLGTTNEETNGIITDAFDKMFHSVHEGGDDFEIEHEFSISVNLKTNGDLDPDFGDDSSSDADLDIPGSTAGAAIALKGAIKLTLGMTYAYYIAWDQQYVAVSSDLTSNGTISLSGEYNLKIPIPIGSFHTTKALKKAGTEIHIGPNLVAKAGTALTFGYTYEKHIAFAMRPFSPITDLSLPGHGKIYIPEEPASSGAPQSPSVEITAFAGIEYKITAKIAGELLGIDFGPTAGVEGKLKPTIFEKNDATKHECTTCFTITEKFKADFTYKLILFQHNDFGIDAGDKWILADEDLGTFYWSLTYNEFALGSCPHLAYRVDITFDGDNAEGKTVYDQNKTLLGTLNGENKLTAYLEPGNGYVMTVTINGTEYKSKPFDVGHEATFVTFGPGKKAPEPEGVVGSGKCGDNLTWKLDANGTLTISGTGDMYEYGSGLFGDTERVPWLSDLMSESPINKLVLNEGITGISDFAFTASKIETLDIPSSVTSIGSAAFSSCKNLVSVSGGENVSYIGSMAFLNCSSLVSIDLSDKLEGLYMGTFKDCKSLTSITIPGNVAVYGLSDFVFSGCEKLKTVTLMYGVVSIDGEVFKDCTALETITLPDTLTNIYSDAFKNCTALTKVFYYGTEEDWNKISISAGNDALTNATRSYIAEKHTSGSCGANLTWTLNDAGVLTIQGTGRMTDYSQASWNTDDVQKVIVKDGVTSIGAFAFYNCSNLTEVQLPSSLLEIGDSAFANCHNLTNVQLPANLTTLGSRAFWNDNGLLSINLPDALVSIGARAFEYCSALQGSLTLPQGIVDVPPYLFRNCDNLESVQLASGTKSIGDYAFDLCSGLTAIKIPDSVTQIGDYAFDWCYNLKDVTLSKNLVSIGKSAFSGTAITSMDLPDSVTSIGTFAFKQTNLTGTFTIPSGVTEISTGLFENCHNLKEVVMPSGITEIGTYAFYNTGITNFVIPDGITVVGMYTFYGADLESITIPSSVTAIGESAFHCFGLKDVYYAGSQSEWSEIKIYSENEKLTEATIHYNYSSGGSQLSLNDPAQPVENSITTGKTSTSNNTMHAVFNGLTAGEAYAVIVSKSAKDPFNADNLIYVNQKTAGTDGVLDVPFTSSESGAAYVVACRRGNEGPTVTTKKYKMTIRSKNYTGELVDSYIPGHKVVIATKSDDGNGNKFNCWRVVAGDVTLADPTSPSTSFIMPEHDVELEIVFYDGDPDSSGNPSGGDDGGGAAILLIGGVAAAAAVAGVVMMMPVEVSGTVKLADQPVANASVQVLQGETVKAETATDATGHFVLKVRRGNYTLRVQWTDAEGQPMMRTVDFKAPNANLNVAA